MYEYPPGFDFSLLDPIEGKGDPATGLRLERVAEIIEALPNLYSQEGYGDFNAPMTATYCGSARCVAGWSTTVAPYAEMWNITGIETIAAQAYGLDQPGAFVLFSTTAPPEIMPMVLRRLAKLPSAERDKDAVIQAFADEGYAYRYDEADWRDGVFDPIDES